MPFCEPCERHWAPSAMTPEGACPTCGAVLMTPVLVANARGLRPDAVETVGDDTADKPEAARAPWHFKLLVGALVVYLGFRGVQGIEWLARHV